MKVSDEHTEQGRTPPPKKKISLPYKFLCCYWLLFFLSLTQDKFDIVPVCALAHVFFTYLHTTIYTPQMKFLATPVILRHTNKICMRYK